MLPDFHSHLSLQDMTSVASSSFDLEQFISDSLPDREVGDWGLVKTDWPDCMFALERLATLLGNTLHYDDKPLYMYCLKNAVRGHQAAMRAEAGDRERLLGFAEGLVSVLCVHDITIIDSTGERYPIPRHGFCIDGQFHRNIEMNMEIETVGRSWEDLASKREEVFSCVFLDLDFEVNPGEKYA